jgi:hypothetical protein
MGRRALILVPQADGLRARPFFNTIAELIWLARQRFLEQGELPTGLVPYTVPEGFRRRRES